MLHLLSLCLSKLNHLNSFKFLLRYDVFLEICECLLDSFQLICVLQQPRADDTLYIASPTLETTEDHQFCFVLLMTLYIHIYIISHVYRYASLISTSIYAISDE